MSLCIGDIVSNGLNMIFATDRFTPDVIPLFCATMSLIGNFFKNRNRDINDKIEKIKNQLNSKISED